MSAARPVPKNAGIAEGFALGRQMTVEFYDCSPRNLADAALMEQVFLAAARESGATVIDSRFHQFNEYAKEICEATDMRILDYSKLFSADISALVRYP